VGRGVRKIEMGGREGGAGGGRTGEVRSGGGRGEGKGKGGG